jgi:5'-nucleotidase
MYIGCDLVIPMTHQIMAGMRWSRSLLLLNRSLLTLEYTHAEDRQMAAAQLGFPLLIGAHDHDPYLEKVAGATIVKTGADANMAAIIDISWSSPDSECEINVELVETKLYPPDPEMSAAVRMHLKVTIYSRHTWRQSGC